MHWASERWRQLRFGIALCRIQLRLDEKDAPSEVGTSEVGISEVGPSEVGHSEISASEVCSDEVCPSQVGSAEIGSFEFGSNEVGSSVVLLLVPDFGPHEFACAQQQGIDVSPVLCHVQFHESIWVAVSKAFSLLQCEAEFTVERVG
jgi:hypothetical protein